MRTEAEMIELILSYARQDERVRAVVMNGSRVNPNIQADIFQDYDIVYFVEDVAPFIRNRELIRYFGETMICQLPDEMGESDPINHAGYAYLMQFVDGNRIDLTFRTLDSLQKDLRADSLTQVLLDKDGIASDVPPPGDLSYLPKPPAEKQFAECCNEFWWLNPYVAKGLWRGELIGPKYFLDELMRTELLKMLNWHYGMQTDFRRAPGKLGRFFPEVLGPELWAMLKNTYAAYEPDAIWDSMLSMGDLFRVTAKEVAGHFGYSYPEQDDIRVSAFIRKVRELPPDASDFDL